MAGEVCGDRAVHARPPELRSKGLQGYISFRTPEPPEGYGAGMGFYSAAWSLVDGPPANFQIGLAGCWIMPDNRDNRDTPLCPEGTRARRWKERGPTWSSVFQTIEGGLGYWAGNHFPYGPPKFSMNGTPQCYDYEIGSPGWSFFYSDTALPDDQLGLAQLSNRLLIPPDGLPFAGRPNGEFLGYAWMALPLTEPSAGEPPTGEQSWTCFLTAANFRGPIAFYIPETWSKIGRSYPFVYGRGLDSRPGRMGGGAMEINTVPRWEARDALGRRFSKIPELRFPVGPDGRACLVRDVVYYSRAALYDAVRAWRDGGAPCSGQFDPRGMWKPPSLFTQMPPLRQDDLPIQGLEKFFQPVVLDPVSWGLQWATNAPLAPGQFPSYFRYEGDHWVPVHPSEVPAETGLAEVKFLPLRPGRPYTSPTTGAWARPGPVRGPFQAKLLDGSVVTYYWYRFIDQPSFQQYNWSEEKKARLQKMVEVIHTMWTPDREYMPPLSRGDLVTLDPALLVTPPPGLEVGYVPIVTHQAAQ